MLQKNVKIYLPWQISWILVKTNLLFDRNKSHFVKYLLKYLSFLRYFHQLQHNMTHNLVCFWTLKFIETCADTYSRVNPNIYFFFNQKNTCSSCDRKLSVLWNNFTFLCLTPTSHQQSWKRHFFVNPDFLGIQIWRKITRKLRQFETATQLCKL